MDTTKKTNIEEALCEYLAKNFRGANNPVSSKTLETVFHVKGTEISDWGEIPRTSARYCKVSTEGIAFPLSI